MMTNFYIVLIPQYIIIRLDSIFKTHYLSHKSGIIINSQNLQIQNYKISTKATKMIQRYFSKVFDQQKIRRMQKIIFLYLPLLAIFLTRNLFDNDMHTDLIKFEIVSSNIQNVMFSATEQLNQQKIIDHTEQVTAIFTSANRYDLLQKTLNSFFTMNKYPIKSIIAIDDGLINQSFLQMVGKYRNITWVSSNRKIGQAYAIDTAYSLIRTPYYFHSQDDWLYTREGFIDESLQILKKFPIVSQPMLIYHQHSKSSKRQGIVSSQQQMYASFNLNPGFHRTSQYANFVNQYGGISDFFKFNSFGLGIGGSQFALAQHFALKQFRGYRAKYNYYQHIGSNRGLPRAL